MAKCIICGTRIPFGSYQCPNCGYESKNQKIKTNTNKKEIIETSIPSDKKKSNTTILKEIVNVLLGHRKMEHYFYLGIASIFLIFHIINHIFPEQLPHSDLGLIYVYDYAELSSDYPDVANAVQPYRDYLTNRVGDTHSIHDENYSLINDLSMASMRGNMQLNDCTLEITIHYQQGVGYSTYPKGWSEYAYVSVPTEQIDVFEEELKALANYFEINYLELYEYASDFNGRKNDVSFLMAEGTFQISFYNKNLSYGFVRSLE